MHHEDTFARLIASGSEGAQPKSKDLLHCFEEERAAEYKGERYCVRNNGAILRLSRAGARLRKWDEIWTFGMLNKQTGYLAISDHVVHRIVAVAFHGDAPSAGHVVDHIDTNRRNNRPENLRWVTRLENILLNPITRARIEFAYGSLEAFFANPGSASVPNMEWMRTVTKEEAAQSLARLRKWAEEGKAPVGGTLGDWVFARRSRTIPEPDPEPLDKPSLTVGAIQRRWRTPTEFPLCPQTMSHAVLDEYLSRLSVGAIVARNQHGESTVVEAGMAAGGALSIVCKTPSGIKNWSVVRVFVEGDLVCHESGGMFFDLKGAMKAHLVARGVAFDEAEYESIDDYA
ncbi:MAG: HNH endonuclease [Alphaproteobacteria bacterium]|nr:HNH endonuclease [Alphaproteobacteria bacterium]